MSAEDKNKRERVAEARQQRSFEERLRRMQAIAERCAARLGAAGPPIDHGELLYDERGLPK